MLTNFFWETEILPFNGAAFVYYFPQGLHIL